MSWNFVHTPTAKGLLLLSMVPVALLWANGHVALGYEALWVMMTVFFFVVGLEIKRELTVGQLRDRRKGLTPMVAALGGMLAPAAIFVLINAGGPVAVRTDD